MAKDSFSTVTRQGYGSRIKESIGGVLVGLILFVVAFPLLFWNEGRAIKTARGLEEGAAAVVTVDSAEVDRSQDKKLVHLVGTLVTDEKLQDSTFNLDENAVALRRVVEMFQWEESEETEEREKVGGSVEKTTTYSYETGWHKELIRSGDFAQARGHENPTAMPYSSEESRAKKVEIGAYRMPDFFISKLNDYESIPVNEERLAAMPPEVREGAQSHHGALYLGEDPDNPAVGDTRVTFEIIRPGGEVSLIARQVGNTFEPYTTKTKTKIALLQTGHHSAESMFETALADNAMMTWVLRLAGFLMAFIGLAMLFRPLAVLASVIPFIGRIFRAGTTLVAGVIAVPLSLLTIGFAWLFYRPLIGIPLLLLAVGLVVFGIITIRKRARKNAPAGPVA